MIGFRVSVLVTLLLGCGADSPQHFAIQVNADGYSPSSVQVEAGRPITLAFTRTTDEGCGQELAIPSLEIRRPLPLNETVEIELAPQQAGTIQFTCGMNMYEGALVVQ